MLRNKIILAIIFVISIVINQALSYHNNKQIGIVSGKVLDSKNAPLPFVNVFFTDGMEGTMTDENGCFKIETNHFGKRVLRVSHIGYEQKDVDVIIKKEAPVILNITLEESYVEMETVTITASSFTAADKEGQTLTSLDIVTTAGAAADIFKAIQTFPGVTQVDEGAGMFVRGGDVSETIVMLDGATLVHPYRYESDTGGYFGMINPFLLSGTYFSSGAFSAKYGNALSGILAMESLGMPDCKSIDFGMGLAAISLGASYPIIPDKLGVRFSGNYSDTKTLFKVNGGTEKFNKFPLSWDGNLSVIYKYSNRGYLKFFNHSAQDDIGVLYESPTYSGNFISGTDNILNNVYWRQMFGKKLLTKSSLSQNRFHQDIMIGNLSLKNSDVFTKWRTDITYTASKKFKINSGFEIDNTESTVSGSYPDDENNLHPDAESITFSNDYSAFHNGLYLECEINFSQRIFTISGLRVDYLNEINTYTADPRFSIGYRFADTQILKLATGRYHQYPKAQCIDAHYGNPNLLPLEAIHYVAGYELKSEITNFRAELYYKDYNDLPIMDYEQNFASDGYGYSYGTDIFIKGNLPFISGWMSYSYLVSERKELEYLKLVPTNYDIRHNFIAALKSRIGESNSFSLTYRYTSGKPYTAALNQWNSDRLPSIQRLDISWSYFTFFSGGNFLVLYAAVSNLLDRRNLYGYRYNPEYTERTKLKSTFGRSVYFGFSVSLR